MVTIRYLNRWGVMGNAEIPTARSLLGAALIACAPLVMAADAVPPPPAWVAESNQTRTDPARGPGQVLARSRLVLRRRRLRRRRRRPRSPAYSERQQADLQAAQAKLEALRATVSDPQVRQDVDILIKAAADQRQTLELNRALAAAVPGYRSAGVPELPGPARCARRQEAAAGGGRASASLRRCGEGL